MLNKITSWFSKTSEGCYFSSRYADIKWNAATRIAIIKWRSTPKKEDAFAEVCTKALELIKSQNTTLWYENRSQFHYNKLPASSQRWFESAFRTKLVEAGVQKSAFLVHSKEYNRLKYKQWLYKKSDDGMEERYFDDKTEGVAWLIDLKRPKSL